MSEPLNALVPVERPGASANSLLRELAAVCDIPIRVSIEVGRLKVSVADFLRLTNGAVLEIKKLAGEPFEVSLNGVAVAKGEVIVVEQLSGVRIVEVIKPSGAA